MKFHSKNLYGKLGVKSRKQLMELYQSSQSKKISGKYRLCNKQSRYFCVRQCYQVRLTVSMARMPDKERLSVMTGLFSRPFSRQWAMCSAS